MSDSRWSFNDDPPRDEALARLLRTGIPPVPEHEVAWDELHGAILRAARAAPGARQWWDVVLEWRRVAVAASVAAMLAAGALFWQAGGGTNDEVALAAEAAAPESVALARVVAAYPDDAVLTSLLQTAREDELTDWGSR